MKYLYCPKCKELRVKPWYSLRDRCARCHNDVRVIDVPKTATTYAVYVLAAGAFAAVYAYTRLDDRYYLWLGLALVVAMMALQFKDLLRGEKYAKAKIKITKSDIDLRKKGWG